MFPTIQLGSFAVPSFTLAMAVAFVAAGALGRSQARAAGVDPRVAFDVLPFALVGGLAGAKLMAAVLHWEAFVADPGMLFSARSGLVWYGGLALGVAAVLWRARSWGLPPLMVLAGAAAPVALGHAIGRIGCFLVGDDYGRPTSSWVGIAFPEGAPPTTAGELRALGAAVDPSVPDTVVLAVHPTQLYEAAVLLLLAYLTWRLWRRGVAHGLIVAFYAAYYGCWRFGVEFLRVKDDHLPFGLTISQVISVGLVGAAILLWRLRRRSSSTAPQPLLAGGLE